MKLVYRELWSQDVTAVDELRLSVTLRMLKSPHFNAKMNALKEVSVRNYFSSVNVRSRLQFAELSWRRLSSSDLNKYFFNAFRKQLLLTDNYLKKYAEVSPMNPWNMQF